MALWRQSLLQSHTSNSISSNEIAEIQRDSHSQVAAHNPQCVGAMARRTHTQLALALSGHAITVEATSCTESRARGLAAGTNPARLGARRTRTRTLRTRTMPSRDSRGRFVSWPTTAAPSWYVLCADGYRIPGEPPPEAILPPVPTARQPLPRAVARSRPGRARLCRADWLTWLVLIIGYLALGGYGLHLPRPHH